MGARKRASKAKLAKLSAQAKARASGAAERAEQLLALIARRKQRILEDFYDIGQALHEIEQKKLFAALGFRSFDALLAGRNVMGRTQAYKLMAIVKELPRAQALELGQERSYALAALAAATPSVDDAASLLRTGIKVHGKTKSVKQLSRRDMETLAREARAKSFDPARRNAITLARKLEQRLKKRAKDASVRVVRSGSEFWVYAMMPLDEFATLVGER